MRKPQLTAAALGVVMAACATACTPPSSAVDSGKIADAVKADWANMTAAFNAADAKRTVASDAPDVVNMFHGQANGVGIDADLKNTQSLFAAGAGKVVYSDPTVDVAASGDMAVYRSAYVWAHPDPKTKKAVTEYGNGFVGYKKQADGSWKIAWTIFADTPPPAARPASTS